MSTGGDIADWWDQQHKESLKYLDELVETYPNWFAVTVATAGATSMQLGAGLVDVLRLGEGLAQGGMKGVAQDGLRLLQLAPVVGKLSRLALARFLTDPGGGICTWVSATKALRQVGAKMFASVDDLAKAAGLGDVSKLGGAFVDRLIPVLEQLGARVTNLAKLSSIKDVENAIKGKGVVLFSIEWIMPGKGAVGHTIYAFRDTLGRLRFADRTGAIVASIADLEKYYPGIAKARIYGSAALVEGPTILIADGIAILAMEVRALLVANKETAAQTLDGMKARDDQGLSRQEYGLNTKMQNHSTAALNSRGNVKQVLSPSIRSNSTTGYTAAHKIKTPFEEHIHTVKSGDWLSKLAQHYYNDMYKWPIIYSANRHIIGSNPNRILPGQQLLIPALSDTKYT